MRVLVRRTTGRHLTLILILAGIMASPASGADATSSTLDPGPRFKIETDVVRVPVVVVDKEGRLYTDLKKEQFKILEDGVEQPVTIFTGGEAPMNIVLLLEYSSRILPLLGEVLYPAGMFISQILHEEDYAALISFDIKPRVVSDFTSHRGKLFNSLRGLANDVPFFRDSSLYDALEFALAGNMDYAGLSRVQGRTAVLLISTGRDSLSKINFDEARKVVANAGVPVYSIGIGEGAALRADPYTSDIGRLEHYQSRNTLRTFSESSGGRSYTVRFQADIEEVLKSIAAMIRFQYTLGYTPLNDRQEGKKRKIKVLVDIDGDGEPDNKRLQLQHRQFYVEPKYTGT